MLCGFTFIVVLKKYLCCCSLGGELEQMWIIWEMFHGRISLNLVLLLLLVNIHLHGFQLLVLLPYFTDLYQKDKSFDSKVKFRQASIWCKRVLEAAKLASANKTNNSITSQNLGSCDFWQIANSVLNKGKSAIPLLFSGLEVLPSASDKAQNCLLKTLLKTLILMTQISTCFPFYN